MRLQLLVNHYNEPDSLVQRFLHSVEMQEVANDFEVLIYSDGTELSPALLGGYSFPIRYKSLPHRGVCATRNALLDDATADYLMFCDIDDCFHSTLGLYRVLKAIDDLGSDVIASPFDAEVFINGKPFYHKEELDTIRVHGKAFRRGYLIENDIRFPDEMEFSGDMYFLWLAFNLSDKVCWILESFYVWKSNDQSVTRKNPYHCQDTYEIMLKGYELLYQNLYERNRRDLQEALVASTLSMAYLNSHSPTYTKGPSESVRRFRDSVASLVKRYGHLYDKVPTHIRVGSYEAAKTIHGEPAGCNVKDIPNWITQVTTG